MQTLPELLAEIKVEFPDFVVLPKNQSKLMKLIGWFLKAVSFGKTTAFMDTYVTTIGHTVYTPAGWDSWSDASKIVLLRHERVHMRQQKRFTRVLFSFLYLVPFLPVFLAYGRARLEMEAYTETIKAEIELHGTARVWSKEYQDWMISQFTGPGYLWMWPFKTMVAKWVKTAVDKAIDDYVGYKPKL